MLGACVIAVPARADDCAVIRSRSSLAALSGARITAVSVLSDAPELPGIARPFAALHPTSRTGTIRRQLLFAPGDTVDTLLVGETMRRLRRQRLFKSRVAFALAPRHNFQRSGRAFGQRHRQRHRRSVGAMFDKRRMHNRNPKTRRQ